MSKKNDKGAFRTLSKPAPALAKAARVAIDDVLRLRKGESALIITNPKKDVFAIAQALYDAVQASGGKPTLLVQPVKASLDFAEASVAMALRAEPDVTISLSHAKLGKDPYLLSKPLSHEGKKYDSYFTYLMAKKKMRAFWSPTVTAKIFAQTVPIDYKALRQSCRKVKGILDRADKVRVTAPSGTDLLIGLKGRKAMVDDGDIRKPGAGGNLPAGETFASPELGTSHGVVAFDGSIALDKGELLIRKPIVCHVEDGFVTEVKGGREAGLLRDTLERAEKLAHEFARTGKIPAKEGPRYARNARNIGELGVGLNRAAKIVGNVLEDEKVYRTCHIAIGSNYDEDAPALIHLDGLVRNPTLTAIKGRSERTFMVDGELV